MFHFHKSEEIRVSFFVKLNRDLPSLMSSSSHCSTVIKVLTTGRGATVTSKEVVAL